MIPKLGDMRILTRRGRRMVLLCIERFEHRSGNKSKSTGWEQTMAVGGEVCAQSEDSRDAGKAMLEIQSSYRGLTQPQASPPRGRRNSQD